MIERVRDEPPVGQQVDDSRQVVLVAEAADDRAFVQHDVVRLHLSPHHARRWSPPPGRPCARSRSPAGSSAGTPEHSNTTSGPIPPVRREHLAAHVDLAGIEDVGGAEGERRTAGRPGSGSLTSTVAAPATTADRSTAAPMGPNPEISDVVARADAATCHGVEPDGERLDQRPDAVVDVRGQRHEARQRHRDVLGERPVRREADGPAESADVVLAAPAPVADPAASSRDRPSRGRRCRAPRRASPARRGGRTARGRGRAAERRPSTGAGGCGSSPAPACTRGCPCRRCRSTRPARRPRPDRVGRLGDVLDAQVSAVVPDECLHAQRYPPSTVTTVPVTNGGIRAQEEVRTQQVFALPPPSERCARGSRLPAARWP